MLDGFDMFEKNDFGIKYSIIRSLVSILQGLTDLLLSPFGHHCNFSYICVMSHSKRKYGVIGRK